MSRHRPTLKPSELRAPHTPLDQVREDRTQRDELLAHLARALPETCTVSLTGSAGLAVQAGDVRVDVIADLRDGAWYIGCSARRRHQRGEPQHWSRHVPALHMNETVMQLLAAELVGRASGYA